MVEQLTSFNGASFESFNHESFVVPPFASTGVWPILGNAEPKSTVRKKDLLMLGKHATFDKTSYVVLGHTYVLPLALVVPYKKGFTTNHHRLTKNSYFKLTRSFGTEPQEWVKSKHIRQSSLKNDRHTLSAERKKRGQPSNSHSSIAPPFANNNYLNPTANKFNLSPRPEQVKDMFFTEDPSPQAAQFGNRLPSLQRDLSPSMVASQAPPTPLQFSSALLPAPVTTHQYQSNANGRFLAILKYGLVFFGISIILLIIAFLV